MKCRLSERTHLPIQPEDRDNWTDCGMINTTSFVAAPGKHVNHWLPSRIRPFPSEKK
jgi:hypothetical protein